MFVKTPGWSKGECKHLRRGGGVYMYVHGRVSRDTFGSRPWLKTELAWSLESETWCITLCCLSPQTKQGHTNWHYLIHINVACTWCITPLCPAASFFPPPHKIMFVSGLISRRCCSWLKPQERAECLLIPASIWGAVKQTVISPIPYTHCLWERPTETAASLSELTLTLFVCLGGDVGGGYIYVSHTKWNRFLYHKSAKYSIWPPPIWSRPIIVHTLNTFYSFNIPLQTVQTSWERVTNPHVMVRSQLDPFRKAE